MVRLGERIRTLRLTAGLSVSEVSRRIGIDRAWLRQLEHAGPERSINLASAIKLADALGVSLEKLAREPLDCPCEADAEIDPGPNHLAGCPYGEPDHIDEGPFG